MQLSALRLIPNRDPSQWIGGNALADVLNDEAEVLWDSKAPATEGVVATGSFSMNTEVANVRKVEATALSKRMTRYGNSEASLDSDRYQRRCAFCRMAAFI